MATKKTYIGIRGGNKAWVYKRNNFYYWTLGVGYTYRISKKEYDFYISLVKETKALKKKKKINK